MRGRIGFALLGIVLVATAPGGLTSHAAVLAGAPGRTSAEGNPLYSWKVPAKGHAGAWLYDKGMLAYDGESSGALFARFSLKHVADFAIQADIQGLGPGGPQATLAGFGLVVRKTSSDPHTSISGGSFFSSNAEDNNPELYWNGDTAGGAAFSPGTSWHVYRLEVRANQYTLLIDGKPVVQYVIDEYRNPVQAGIFSMYYRVRIKSVEVFALSASQSVTPYPPTKPFALAYSDLPPTTFYDRDLSHFYSNEEIARMRNVSLTSVEASGRIISYGEDFAVYGADLADIYSTVTAFKTSVDARADITSRMNSLRQSFSIYQNLRELPSGQVGEESAGLSFDASASGYSFTFLILLFNRGSYDVQLTLTIIAGTLTRDQLLAETLAFARIVDQRLQQA